MTMSNIEPFVRRKPGDVIRSSDWNELQIKTREHQLQHRHTGEADGLKIPREGIEDKAIDGGLIDPEASVSVKELKISSALSVNGNLDMRGKNRRIFMGGESLSTYGIAFDENYPNHGIFYTEGSPDHVSISPNGDDKKGVVDVYGDGVVDIKGSLIRRVFAAHGNGPNDEIDNGRVMSRTLSFKKLRPDTAIRILYHDNFRVYGNGIASRWEIKLNGSAPPGGQISQDIHDHVSVGGITNHHSPGSILGYARGMPAGTHEIQVWVGPVPGYAQNNVYTGWNNSSWSIEAEEVWV
ncbi:hypothetical protein ACFL2V_00025 [Pseudomonadota bacterium]